MRRRTLAAALAALLLGAGALALLAAKAFSPGDRDADREMKAGVLVLEPGYILFRTGIVENLVETGYDFRDPVPNLAERWEKLGGGAWRFHIRPGVTFHNGDGLTAEHAALALARHEKHKADWQTGIALRWEVEGPMTLRMETTPGVPLPLHFGDVQILHPDSYDVEGRLRKPIGTGPFRVVSVDFGDEMILEAHESYWRGAPRIRRIRVKEVHDPQTRILMLESGELDWIQMVLRQDVPRLRKDGWQLHTAEFLYNILGYFQCGKPPFDDPRVRRAVSHALDRRAIVDAAFEGMAVPSDLFFPEGVPFTSPRAARFPFDRNRARALIEEAGFRRNEAGVYEKGGRALRLEVLARGNRPAHQLAGQVMQQQLKEAGILCDVAVREHGAWTECVRRGDFDLALSGRGIRWCRDPGGYFDTDWRSDAEGNHGRYRNPELDRLAKRARLEEDEARRSALLRRMIEIWSADAPVVMLCHDDSREIYAVAPCIEGAGGPFPTMYAFPGPETRWKK